jgi:hypothetical protein
MPSNGILSEPPDTLFSKSFVYVNFLVPYAYAWSFLVTCVVMSLWNYISNITSCHETYESAFILCGILRCFFTEFVHCKCYSLHLFIVFDLYKQVWTVTTTDSLTLNSERCMCQVSINLRVSYSRIYPCVHLSVYNMVVSEIADVSCIIAALMFPELAFPTATVKYFEHLFVLCTGNPKWLQPI